MSECERVCLCEYVHMRACVYACVCIFVYMSFERCHATQDDHTPPGAIAYLTKKSSAKHEKPPLHMLDKEPKRLPKQHRLLSLSFAAFYPLT